MKKLIIAVFLLLAASLFANAQDAKAPAASKYTVGQKWSYNARPGEEDSYLIIVKIDDDPKLDRIIHIALRDLKIKNPRSPDVTQNVNHMPFSGSSDREERVEAALKTRSTCLTFKRVTGYGARRSTPNAPARIRSQSEKP